MRLPPGIYLRGRIYWITYMLNGKQHFESSHSRDLRVAVALVNRRKADVAHGRITISPSQAPLFSELLQSYNGQIENPNTAKRYRLAESKLVDVVGDRSIAELSPLMFDKFKETRIKGGVTPAGVNRELALARAALNVAVQRRLIPYSPFAGVKLFNEAKHRKPPRALSYADERTILSCCDLRLGTITSFLLESGERVGEALATRWADVDFEEATITVVQSKTVAGRRVIPMSSLCKSVLLAWHSATIGASEYVFFNPQNPTVHIRSVKTAWRQCTEISRLKPFPSLRLQAFFRDKTGSGRRAGRDHRSIARAFAAGHP